MANTEIEKTLKKIAETQLVHARLMETNERKWNKRFDNQRGRTENLDRRLQAGRQRVLSREQPERDRNLPAPRHAQLLPQDVAVRLRRSRRDAEHEADLLVRQPLRDQLDDLPLARGDA